MISVTRASLSAEQALLGLLHLRLPEALLLEESYGRRVIRDRHVAPHRAIARPLLEHGMDRPELALRSEEHTSELQSHHDLVCRLLPAKKKNLEPTLAELE